MRLPYRFLCSALWLLLLNIVTSSVWAYEATLSNTWVSALVATPEGELFVCGRTSVQQRPGRGVIRIGPVGNDATDITLTKVSRSGRVLWSALIGGTGSDRPVALFRDTAGNLTMVGHTSSADFAGLSIAVSGSDQVVFVSKLDSTGTNVLHTKVVSPPGFYLQSATADSDGNIYLLGTSTHADIDTFLEDWVPFGQAVTVIKLSPDAEVLFQKRFGGTSHDWPTAIAVDAAQNIYISGNANSGDFPAINAPQTWAGAFGGAEVFVTKVSSDGNDLVYSALFGGDANDDARGIAVNAAGEVVVVGTTESPVFPAAPDRQTASCVPAASRNFATKLDVSGSNVIRTDFLGSESTQRFYFPWFVNVSSVDDAKTIIAGTTGAGYPVLIAIDALGQKNAFPIISACEGGAMTVVGLTTDPNGRLYVAGDTMRERTVIKTFDSEPAPMSRPVIVSPRQGQMFGEREAITLAVAPGDFGDSLSQVSFFNGGRLIAVVTNSPFTFAWTNAAPGQHSIRAVATRAGVTSRTCPIRVTVKRVRNDEPDGAITFRGERDAVRGSTFGATTTAPLQPGWKDVWYSWTAPRSGTFRFRITEATGETRLAIGTNQSLLLQQVNLRTEAGEQHLVRVASGFNTMFKLFVAPLNAAENDDFSNRLPLSGDSISVTGSLATATVEDADPANAAAALWYTWVAPRDGVFAVGVMGAFGHSVFVARGASQTNSVSPYSWNPSIVYFNASAGEEFSIAVIASGYVLPEPLGEFTLEIKAMAGPPPNDKFVDRIVLGGALVSVTNSTFGATTEAGEPKHTSSWTSSPGSVWWSWVAPTNGAYSVAATFVSSLAVGTSVAVYRRSPTDLGTDVRNLVRVAGGDGAHEAVFLADAGAAYEIAVADAGAPALVLSIKPVHPPANDHPDNAKTVSGRVALLAGSTRYTGDGTVQWSGDVWYRWIAPSDGSYAVSFITDFWQHSVFVNWAGGQSSSSASGGNDVVFKAQAGVEYSIAIVAQHFGGPFSAQIHPVERPANDDFADRIALDPNHLVFAGNARYATSELGDPLGGKSLWWSWTAPETGRVVLLSSNHSALAIYTGDAVTNLVLVAQTYGKRMIFEVQAGVTYAIAVRRTDSDEVQWTHHPNLVVPSNDNSSDAMAIVMAPYLATNFTANLSWETNEPPHEQYVVGAGKTLWWKWAPTNDVSVELSTEGSDFNTVLEVFTGTGIENLHREIRATSGAPDFRAALSLRLRAATTYFIRVDGSGSDGFGNLRFSARVIPTPLNDDFANRTMLTTNFVEATLAGASRELQEFPGVSTNEITVWWQWVAPATGYFIAELDSEFNLDVFRVISPLSTEVFRDVTRERDTNIFGISRNDRYHFHAGAGTNYIFRIRGSENTMEGYTFRLSQLLPPGNDHFSNSFVLSGTNVSIAGSNTLATYEPGEPFLSFNSRNTVWYRWTSPDTRVYRVATSARYTRQVSVYNGDSVTNLIAVKSPPYVAGNLGELIFRATAGLTYHISVSDSPHFPVPGSELIADTRLVLRVLPALSPANDDFANRTPLVGANVSVGASNVDATTEEGEPVVGSITRQSVWWTWTAQSSGLVTINVTNASPAGAVFQGDAMSNLTVIARNAYDVLPITFDAVAGQTYIICIDGNSTLSGPFTLTIRAPEAQPAASAVLPVPGGLRLRVGQGQTIETSTNLIDWSPLWTNSSAEALDREIRIDGQSRRFYRIR